MRELFYTLGVLALLRYLGLSLGIPAEMVILGGILSLDYWLKTVEIKSQAKLKGLDIIMRELRTATPPEVPR